MKNLYEICEEIYVKGGQYAVYAFIKESHPSIPWEYCQPCEDVVPSQQRTCLVCGSPTAKDAYLA